MLVLSRLKGESIVIGAGVRVTILEVRGNKIKLGVEAPRDVPVHRSEIYECIHRDRASDPGKEE